MKQKTNNTKVAFMQKQTTLMLCFLFFSHCAFGMLPYQSSNRSFNFLSTSKKDSLFDNFSCELEALFTDVADFYKNQNEAGLLTKKLTIIKNLKELGKDFGDADPYLQEILSPPKEELPKNLKDLEKKIEEYINWHEEEIENFKENRQKLIQFSKAICCPLKIICSCCGTKKPKSEIKKQ